MDKVIIEKTRGADTRSATSVVDKETLLRETHLHKNHVMSVMKSLGRELYAKADKHDFTKVDYIDKFHDNFVKAFNKEIEFKDHEWWGIHLAKERHHINDFMHEDTDLLDLIEMLADCICAGKARTGNVYPIEIDNSKLQKMLSNTIEKIKNAIEVKN